MLIPNLSVLLAERRLTLSRVAQDTRISRTTLTALAGRSAKGIQFDTLNTLCQYLKVTPDALFIYRPFDLSVFVPGAPGASAVEFTVSHVGGAAERYRLDCDARRRFDANGALSGLSVRLSLPAFDDPGEADRNRAILPLLQALPASVLADVERDLLASFDRHIGPDLAPNDYSPDLRWPWE